MWRKTYSVKASDVDNVSTNDILDVFDKSSFTLNNQGQYVFKDTITICNQIAQYTFSMKLNVQFYLVYNFSTLQPDKNLEQ